MIGLIAAVLLTGAPPETGNRDVRMRESAAAAQALQGPLDGAWTLRDAAGRPLLGLQISDPPGGGPLAGAWRAPGPGGEMGVVANIGRRGRRLSFTFAPDDGAGPRAVRLTHRSARLWSGWMTTDGRASRVTLLPGR